MKKWIISANYRDRNSPYRWLVRARDERPEAAVAYKSVRAKGVEFARSSEFEAGFGCTIVAQADEFVAEGPEPRGHRLRFDFDQFLNQAGNPVRSAGELHLDADGTMTAVS